MQANKRKEVWIVVGYIRRYDAMKICEQYSQHCFDTNDAEGQDVADRIEDDIVKVPTADVVEVKHGEWINEGEYLYKCSLCGDKALLRLGGKPCRYCPNCGAKMDLKEGVINEN